MGVGVDRMVMAVILPMGWQGHAIGLAGTGALVFAELAGLIQSFHVVVMAVLGSSNFGLKAQHLLAVLAE